MRVVALGLRFDRIRGKVEYLLLLGNANQLLTLIAQDSAGCLGRKKEAKNSTSSCREPSLRGVEITPGFPWPGNLSPYSLPL